MERLSFLDRAANAAVTYVRYIGKTLWPADLAVYYPHPGTWPLGRVAVSVLVLAGATMAVAWLGRRRRYLVVGWLWYLGTLIPVIGLVQVGSQSAADRYTYIPLTGLFLMAAWGGADWAAAGKARRGWAVGLGAAALAGCLLVTAGQIRLWRNSVVLFEHAIASTEDNIAAHVNLGHALLKRGDAEGAATQYETALGLNAGLADVHSALGLVRAQQGRPREAFDHYSEALRLDPGNTEAHNNLGFLLAQLGRLDEAADQFRAAARSDPGSVTYWLNLARVLAAQGAREEALRSAERALEIAVRTGQRGAATQIREEMKLLRSSPQ
jgi:tetratricopeptide (TPR) repeat protein